MSLRLPFFAFLAILETGACSLIPPAVRKPPFLPLEDTGEIAVRFNLVAPIGNENLALRVYFARLQPDQESGKLSLEGAEFFPSTYISNGHVRLLDAPPGEYAAVAASHMPQALNMDLDSRDKAARLIQILQKPWLYQGPGWQTLFNDSVMEASRVRLEAGQKVYMGDFTVRQQMELHKASRNQRYAAVFLMPAIYRFEPSILAPGGHYLAELEKRADTEKTRAEFWEAEAKFLNQ